MLIDPLGDCFATFELFVLDALNTTTTKVTFFVVQNPQCVLIGHHFGLRAHSKWASKAPDA